MRTAQWTIEELAESAARVLAGEAAASGNEALLQSNGRVREVPDARTIRWYQTTGLVDRPAAMRGRTALYGRRHLAQIVAIKRLQAEGRSLAEIQGLLAGIGDRALMRLAALPKSAGPDAGSRPMAVRSAIRPQFWLRSAEVATPIHTDRTPGLVPPQPPHAVRLAGGVLLVLDSATTSPDRDDLEAIQAASAALLRELRRRGLAPESKPRRKSR